MTQLENNWKCNHLPEVQNNSNLSGVLFWLECLRIVGEVRVEGVGRTVKGREMMKW